MADTDGLIRSNEAAELLGVPYTRFEWAREKAGIVPLLRARVRYYTREQVEAIQQAITANLPPDGWVETAVLAHALGVRQDYVSTVAKQGRLTCGYYMNKWYFPPEAADQLRALRDASRVKIRAAEGKREEDHPLDMATAEDWRTYGFIVREGTRARCGHPLVQVGTGRYAGVLCARCNTVWLRGIPPGSVGLSVPSAETRA